MEIALENVLYFFNDVLGAVDREGKWTMEALDRAVQWAYYCQKVYTEAVSNGMGTSLNSALEKLAGRVVSDKFVPTLDSLKNAPQLLFKELLRHCSSKTTVPSFLFASKMASEPWAKDVILEALTVSSALRSLSCTESDTTV